MNNSIIERTREVKKNNWCDEMLVKYGEQIVMEALNEFELDCLDDAYEFGHRNTIEDMCEILSKEN